MPIENPQLEIEGRPAWRIAARDGVMQVEPFFGEPKLNERAVTTIDYWVFTHHGWVRGPNNGETVAMLRMWLAAKAAWDNEKKQLLEKVKELEAIVVELAVDLAANLEVDADAGE